MADTDKDSVENKLAALRKSYFLSLPTKVQNIRKLWKQLSDNTTDIEPIKALQYAAHTLSGSGATFGAIKISASARAMDELLSNLLEAGQQISEQQKNHLNDLVVQMEQASSAGEPDDDNKTELQQYDPAISQQKLIYIVEDDLHLAEKLSVEFQREKYIVRAFDKLESFRQAYYEQKPGAIIMDMSFPENAEGGAQVMQSLSPSYQSGSPLIFISTRGDITARLAAVKAGANRYFTKPLDIEKLKQTVAGLTHQVPYTPYRVMIVDDDRELAEYYATLLHGAGMLTKVITNPLAALEQVAEWHPDLVMMDVYMPECSGLELASIIRQDDKYTTMPIVFLSSETDIDKQLYALDLGGDAFLTKPVVQQHLLSTVIARVKRSRWLTRLKTELEVSLQKNEAQRKEIEKKEERLRFSQYFGNIGSWDLNVEQKVMHWSEKIAPLLGYGADNVEASYDAFLASVHPEDIQKLTSAFDDCLMDKTAYEIEHRVIWPDGSIHWLLQKGDVIRDGSGKAVRMLGVVQDTTQRKQLERDLATQREFAEQANNAKSEFLSRMSHELRTPLNAIIGFAQLLESDEEQPLHDYQLDSMNEILAASNHLLELIDEVLDLTKIEAGKMQFNIENLPVIDVLLESYSMMIPMAESNHIQLDFNTEQCEETLINADRTKLKQVMFNLMSNAIKYNKPEGKVTVSCEAIGRHRIRLSVKDTGIGIAKHRHADVFKAFNRLGAEASGVEGTGIGLMICKKIIEMMGGELGFHSEEGKGSVFWVEMSCINDMPRGQFDTSQQTGS